MPLACQYKTKLVVLALDDHGIPATATDRVAIVDRLIALTRKGGLPDENLYVDPLVITIATDNNSGLTAFETIRAVKAKYPEVHFTCGLSNISFGQPSRTLINQAFAALAIQAGLDSAIIDPEEKGLRNIVHAAEMVLALDPHCKRYNQAHRSGLIGAQASAQAPAAPQAEGALVAAMKNLVGAMAQSGILDGANLAAAAQPCAATEVPAETEPVLDEASADEARVKEMIAAMVDMNEDKVSEMTTAWLEEGKDPMVLLDVSREAMVEVGRLFDIKEYFVPELILAGEILGDISNAVKPYLKGDSGEAGEKKGPGATGHGGRRYPRHRQGHRGHHDGHQRLRGHGPRRGRAGRQVRGGRPILQAPGGGPERIPHPGLRPHEGDHRRGQGGHA